MVNVSKSGEEGYYPDLQKTTEERLRALSPNNRQLRVEEPVLTRKTMNSDEWNNIISDVSSWKKEMTEQDQKLTEENNNTVDDVDLPPVRQPLSKSNSEKKAENTKKPNRVSDYAAWDKYDADTEMLKIDLEEEREKERKKKEKKQQERQEETEKLDKIVKDAEKLSETERRVLADQEKLRGNEYYQAKAYPEAIQYYNASIAIWPTAKAHNNLAACYLKQCKYSAALAEANKTLEMEPENVKALFRRGVALQHKNLFREALADMDAVLRREPRNVLAQHISKELREEILTLPRTVRIMTDEGFNKPKKIIEMSGASLMKQNLPANSYEVNEFGLPKVMCQCNGSPRFLQLAPRKCPTHFQPRPQPVVNNARIVELSDEPELPKASTKLEIVEVEKSVPIEDFYSTVKCNEVEKSEAVENFCKPTKYVVLDKRTQKTVLTNGETSLKLANGDCNTNITCENSTIDENFELNCPLLEDSSDSLIDPSV